MSTGSAVEPSADSPPAVGQAVGAGAHRRHPGAMVDDLDADVPGSVHMRELHHAGLGRSVRVAPASPPPRRRPAPRRRSRLR